MVCSWPLRTPVKTCPTSRLTVAGGLGQGERDFFVNVKLRIVLHLDVKFRT